MDEEGFQPTPTGFMTKAIHVGQDPEQWNSMAVIPPITMSTTFKQNGPGDYKEFEYSRAGNPSRSVLEKCMAALDNAKYAMAFASGLGATTAVLSLLNHGDHVISGDDLYGGSNRLISVVIKKNGIESSFIDTTRVELVEDAIKPNTKMIWVETPTNPTLKVTDIRKMSELCKKHSLLLAVDNSFESSYFQRPLELGADIVMHSLTKYMNGHSDIIMGGVATNNEEIHTNLRFLQNAMGIVPSPFDCYQVNRSLKTLAIRMEQHKKNGLAVARFLESHPNVESVLHPGLPSHPQHEIFKSQCSGHSGMVSFYIKGGLNESSKFLKALRYFPTAGSLGGYGSLAELPSVMSHASVPEEQKKLLGISDNLIRLSIGLEDPEDLVADMKQALESI